jgi:hypothetical protein
LNSQVTGFGHHPTTEGSETVNNPCDYTFHSNGTVDLVCGDDGHDGEGHVVIDTAGGCDTTIPEQTTRYAISYENIGMGSTADLLVTFDLEEIAYENTGHTFLCTLAGITHYDEMTHDGTYTGSSTFTGENPITGAHIPIEAHKEDD